MTVDSKTHIEHKKYISVQSHFLKTKQQSVIKDTNLLVQTLVIASQQWGLSITEIANDYDLSKELVREALAFYQDRKQEIDDLINSETSLESI